MSSHKHIDKICAIAAAASLLLCLLLMCLPADALESGQSKMGYEDRLFNTQSVHTIDIQMDDWDSFISNAESEEYSLCTLVIDGETYANVGIRGKGNTSLSSVSSMGSSRYSFKVEFDQYDSSFSYHGLDKLSLNNLIQDATYMKDYLTYRLMNEFDVAAPLCSFVQISVNGESWGLYLAVEGVEDAFLRRNYGSDHGELYKPDSMDIGGGRGNGKDFSMEDFNMENSTQSDAMPQMPTDGTIPQMPNDGSMPQMPTDGTIPQMPNDGSMPQMPTDDAAPEMPSGGFPGFDQSGGSDASGSVSGSGRGMGGNFGGFGGMDDMGGMAQPGNMGGGMGSSDVLLQYTDDDPASYSNIFDNAKTDITAADQARLIASLKTLSEGGDVSSAVDIEALMRYFVVHNFVVNGDSYTGGMVHNYYLYEENGLLSMIPWDYNLAFGTFQGSSATDAVNDDIDSPLSVSGTGRPMIDWIFASEEYTELYHEYFSEFLSSVDMDSVITQAYALIAPYVASDPTAFYSYEEFETAVDTLREFCSLRSESLLLQLSGKSETVDASHINLSDMGSMGDTGMGDTGTGDTGMGGMGNMGGADFPDRGETTPPEGFIGGMSFGSPAQTEQTPGRIEETQSTGSFILIPICLLLLASASLIAWKYKR